MSDCKTRAAQSGLSLSRSTDHGQSLAETRKSLKAEIDVLQDKLNEAAKIFRTGKACRASDLAYHGEAGIEK